MKKSFLLILTFLFSATFLLAQDKLAQDREGQNISLEQNKGARTNMNDAWKPIHNQSIASGIFVDDMNGDNTVAGLTARGWVVLNEDGGGTTDPFYQGVPVADGGPFNAYEGPDSGYVASNFNGANSRGVIDHWLISPEVTVQSGDALRFWYRSPDNNSFDDSIFVHYSTTAGTTPADFDQTWGRYLVSENGWAKWEETFNQNGTVRFAVQYYIFDGGPTGTYSNYVGLDLFEVGTPCPIGEATNPSPADGAVDVPIDGNTIQWINGAGTNSICIYFGEIGNLQLVYDGVPISSLSLASVEPLNYSTNYGWQVVGKNDSCLNSRGPIWSFTTMADTNIVCAFMDDFTDTNWTAVNLNDPCDWGYSTTPDIPGSIWGPPDFPATADSFYAFASSDACGSGTPMNVYFTGNFSVDASEYEAVWIEFDSDMEVAGAPFPADTAAVDVSIDSGATWTRVFLRQVDTPAEHAVVDISTIAELQGDIRFRLCYYGDYSWHWAIDNFAVYLDRHIPVELTSFAATVYENDVNLNWSTASELNNMGFEVQRSSNGSDYSKIAFVEGHSTVTEDKNYSFKDKNLEVGSYTYRLKQIDFDGSSEFSNTVVAEIIAPDVYALDQNYPNPFNPSTKIKFSLAADSRVTLTVYDILGQEVVRLINGDLSAGSHNIDFNAASTAGGLNSGVYFYWIDATGVDGVTFTSVKKMILTK